MIFTVPPWHEKTHKLVENNTAYFFRPSQPNQVNCFCHITNSQKTKKLSKRRVLLSEVPLCAMQREMTHKHSSSHEVKIQCLKFKQCKKSMRAPKVENKLHLYFLHFFFVCSSKSTIHFLLSNGISQVRSNFFELVQRS